MNLVSSPNLISLVSTPNLLNLVSTPNLLNLVSTLNLLNLVSSPNLISLVSTPNLLNLVSTPNLLDLVSTPNLLNFVSTLNLLNLVSTTFFEKQLTSTVKNLGTTGYVSTLTGMFTLTPDTPANISLVPPANTIQKIGNDNADDFIGTQERYQYCGVSFQPAFQTYDSQTVNLVRGTNAYYGMFFSNNGYIYVNIDGTPTVSIGSFSPSNLDYYSLELTPDDVIYYRNNLPVHNANSNPGIGQYNLQFNLRKTGDTISNVSFAGTTSPNEAPNSRLFFNTPTSYATNEIIGRSLASSFLSFTGGTSVTTAELISTTRRLYASTIIIPYQAVDTNSAFQLSNTPTQLNFGSTGTTAAQIYMTDILSVLGDSNSRNPLLQIQQRPQFFSGSNNVTYSGGSATFTVPAGVTQVSIELYGGGGGSSSNAGGGAGGLVTGFLQVIPGESLTVNAGGAGNNFLTSAFPNGGTGGANGIGGGGGYSGILRGVTALAIAGGGGGGGSGTIGGDGGGSTGQVGQGTGGGGGGTQSAGGAAGGGNAQSGSLGTGGNGDTNGGGGGGGGSGYYGGGGGADGDAGGGGSSYVGSLTNVVNTQGSGSPSDTDGYVNISWGVEIARPGNLIQVDNFQSRRFIVDQHVRTGINISSINSNYYLDVSGGARVSSLTLGTVATSGLLGTDATATNLYWNGTQLNGGGGGGITTAQLISTVEKWARYPAISSIVFSTNADTNQIVSPGSTFLQLVTDLSVLVTTSTTVSGVTPFRGITASQFGIADQINITTLGEFNYTYNVVAGPNYTGSISTPTITNYDGTLGSLYVSSLFIAAPEGATSGTAGALTTDLTTSKLYYSTNQLANVKVNVVHSTLGTDNPQLYSYDIGKYFLFSTATTGLIVGLPPVENGWNAVIKNMEGGAENIKVDTQTQAVLAPGVTTTVICDGIAFYAL